MTDTSEAGVDGGTSSGGAGSGTAGPDIAADSVVSVRNLHVEFKTPIGVVHALNGVDFEIPRGRVLGIVGESGCGKSVTSRALLRILEKAATITDGEMLFKPGRGVRGRKGEGHAKDAAGRPDREAENVEGATVDLSSLGPNSQEIRDIRGQEIAMIFQEPMTSLNPVYTIGNQIEEAVLLHQTEDRAEARKRAIEMLERVGMPNPERVARSYPHQLSGGMRQRAMIAMALSCTPTLLIADEPTTALDVTTEAQILELMRELQAAFGMSIMFITHSMGVIAQLADEVVVMYLGRVVERAPVDDLFYNPKHPYTIQLLRSIPRIGVDRGKPLEVIKGSIPDPYTTVTGCPFHPRCPSAMPGLCDEVVPLEAPVQDAEPGTVHTVRCHLYPGSTPESVAAEAAAVGAGSVGAGSVGADGSGTNETSGTSESEGAR